ncbi:hypothetical protein PP744_gp007 [Rhizobium phage RHph_N38]|uniref:Uncharacterized protein n=1 Tax=Rhizobium phage RHph_N38 TaxID=2509750 RepID=A0A7S5UTW1_9CAUD|nr:hypothetical protein PP744_gp007 [Rhizobium phage RHph_N38]QIG70470.1 hypothetical protein EVB89_007 [Rhizobium phage RHph_N38]
MAHTYRLMKYESTGAIKPFNEIQERDNARVIAYELSLSTEDRPSSTILVVSDPMGTIDCIYNNGDRYERV